MKNLIIDRRQDFYRLGVDFGSDARVLVVSATHRLVWTKWHKELLGMVGMGQTEFPCSFAIREFSLVGEKIVYGGSEDLFSGGRLSRDRIMSVSAKIDAVFGVGVTAQINLKETLCLGEDVVSGWLKMRKESEDLFLREHSKNDEFLKKAMAVETFDGMKI